MEITQVKKRNIIFTHNLTDWNLNVHLILGNKNNYLIDTGLGTEFISPVLDYIQNDKKPLIVINTHYHWDHIWGNVAFKNNTIISHTLCRQLIESQWDEMIKKQKQYIMGENKKTLPNLVFDSFLQFPEDEIYIFHTPGHTMDGISVLDEAEGVLNIGDNIGDSVEEIVPSLSGAKEIYQKTLSKYTKLEFDVCVSGHNTILPQSIIKKLKINFLNNI